MILTARTSQDRDVFLGGRRLRVRQPTVVEASTAIAAAPGVLKGDPLAWNVFTDVLRQWLPFSLWSLFLSGSVPPIRILWHVISWTFDGAEPRDDPGDDQERKMEIEDALDMALGFPIADMVSDVAGAYGISPLDVEAMPFLKFMIYFRRVERQRAREEATIWSAQSLGNYSDADKLKQDVDALLIKAGLKEKPPKLTREEMVERQKATFAELNRILPSTTKPG